MISGFSFGTVIPYSYIKIVITIQAVLWNEQIDGKF